MNMCFDAYYFLNRSFPLFVLLETTLLVGFVVLIFLVWRKFRSLYRKLSFTYLLSIFFLILAFTAYVFAEEGVDKPNAMRYFPLNAAIKNTCYLDPSMANCPRSLEELINIQSEDFSKHLDDSYLFYEYREEENSYTLVALKRDTRRGAIFDPRFTSKATPGLDFTETRYKKCGNRIEIEDPPLFEGMWNRVMTAN